MTTPACSTIRILSSRHKLLRILSNLRDDLDRFAVLGRNSLQGKCNHDHGESLYTFTLPHFNRNCF